MPLVTVSVLEGGPDETVSILFFISVYSIIGPSSLSILKKNCQTSKAFVLQLNLRKAVDEDDSEGPISPCSIVSIASSKESVARSFFAIKIIINHRAIIITRGMRFKRFATYVYRFTSHQC